MIVNHVYIYIYIAMAYDQYYFKIKVVLEGLILQSNRAILFVLSPHGIHDKMRELEILNVFLNGKRKN